MADLPHQPKPDSPESTLTDGTDDPVVEPATAPVREVPTLPPSVPPAAPAGKRPTQTALPAHRDPKLPSGKRPAAELLAGVQPLPAQHADAVPEPSTTPVRGPPKPDSDDEHSTPSGLTGRRTTGKRPLPSTRAPTQPWIDSDGTDKHDKAPPLEEPPTNVDMGIPISTAVTPVHPVGPLTEPDTAAIGSVPPGARVVREGPSDPESTFVEDVTGDVQPVVTPASSPAAHSQPAAKGGITTHDFQRAKRNDVNTGLNEVQFRRGLYGLAGVGAAILVLAIAWVFVKFDEPAALDPSRPAKLRTGKSPQPAKPKPVEQEPPKQVLIEQTVDAGAGETKTVMAAAGTLRIVTSPDTNVFYEGKDLGPAPVSVTMPSGKNQVTLENKKLFFKRTVNVDVVPNEQTSVRLAFSQGWIELDVPVGARVTIDGRSASTTHMQVWEGSHKVEVTHSDKKRTKVTKTADVTAGMTTSVHFEAPSLAEDD